MPSDIYDYEAAKQREQVQAYNLPLRGVIKEVLGETETIKVSSFGTTGAPEFAVRHPFLGINSWIRAMPEPGTTVLTQRRGDLDQQEIFGYISHQLAGIAKVALKDRNIPFRVLHAGEVDIMSRGLSSAYFGDAGDLELRGGLLSHTISQSNLEIDSNAPYFHRRLHLHDPVFLGHEERFGVVKRFHPLFPNSMTRILQNLDGSFPIEYGRWLTGTDLLSQDLTTIQEGSAVYDTLGLEVRQSSTNRSLRHKRTFFHKLTGDLTFEVDEELNVFVRNKSLATETKVDFGLTNNAEFRMNKLKMNGLDSASLDFLKSFAVKSLKVHVNSGDVGFGAAPLQPAVLGTTLSSSVLTPLLSSTATFLDMLGNDPLLLALTAPAVPPSFIAAKAIAQVLRTVAGNLSSILSTQVKFTA